MVADVGGRGGSCWPGEEGHGLDGAVRVKGVPGERAPSQLIGLYLVGVGIGKMIGGDGRCCRRTRRFCGGGGGSDGGACGVGDLHSSGGQGRRPRGAVSERGALIEITFLFFFYSLRDCRD